MSDFVPTVKQKEALTLLGSPAITNVLLYGGSRCISGDTRILTNKGYIPVRELYLLGGSFVVRAYDEQAQKFVWAKAEAPFVKGRQELYTVTLENGHQFEATGKHRVLTGAGYNEVRSLYSSHGPSQVQLISSPILPQSSLVSCPSGFLPNVRRYFQRVVDFLAYCLVRPHLYDGQPLLKLGGGQPSVPLHNGEEVGTVDDYSCHEASPSEQSLCTPSSTSILLATNHADEVIPENVGVTLFLDGETIYADAPFRSLSPFRVFHRFGLMIARFCIRFLRFLASHTKNASEGLVSDVPCDKSPSYSTITSIIPKGGSRVYYDFTVPAYNNYVAEGVVHHNSGKTAILVYTILVRAIKEPNSRHLMLRLRFNHAKQSLVYDTIPKVAKLAFPGLEMKLSKVDWFYTLPNGAEIWIGGLDDGERAEKILGNEYASIYFNESSQLAWDAISLVRTRLAMKCPGLVNKLYFDCNPPNKRHWTYKVWIEKKDPKDNVPLMFPDAYGSMRMNPTDNVENLADNYIEQNLYSLSERERQRFLKGEFQDDAEGALFKYEDIARNRVQKAPELRQIAVGVDPAVTSNDGSNNTGIVAAGVERIDGEDHFFVLDDATMSGTPAAWAKEAIACFDKNEANIVVGEINQGGDLIEANLRTVRPLIPYQAVRATRGKAIRAEPIATACEKGRLHFVGEFSELENELTSWAPASGEPSPDRMDAMVWAIRHLMGNEKRAGSWGRVD